MEVKVLKPFWDKAKSVDRSVGDTFATNQQRFDEINAAGYGQLVEKIAAKRKPVAEGGE